MQLFHDPLLHKQERMPASNQNSLPPVSRGSECDAQVGRDGVMNRCYQRQAHILKFQHAVAQALVIMNKVVLIAMLAQVLHSAAAKGVRLCKTARQFAAPLNDIAH